MFVNRVSHLWFLNLFFFWGGGGGSRPGIPTCPEIHYMTNEAMTILVTK